MSLNGLAGFAESFAGQKNRQTDQKRQADWMDYHNRRLDQMGSMGAPPPAGGGNAAYTGVPNDAGGMGYAPKGGAAASGDGSLWSLLSQKEGGGRFDTLFGHSQNGGRFAGVDVSKMTLDEIEQFSRPDGEYGQWVKGKVGRVATPMGAAQIVGTTARNTRKALGLSGDTVFNEDTQMRMAGHLADQRLRAAKSPAAKLAGMRAEWEGFKSVPDDVLLKAISMYEQNGRSIGPRPMGAPQQSQQPMPGLAQPNQPNIGWSAAR